MDEDANSRSYESSATRYLRQTENGFLISPTSGLYEPKATHPTNEIHIHVDAQLNNPGQVRERPTGLWQDSIANFISGAALLVSLLTLIGLVLTVKFAYKQWRTMNDTYTEIQKQTSFVQQPAKSSQQQSILMRQQLVGTEAAVLEPYILLQNPHDFYELSVRLLNRGVIPATRIEVNLVITREKGGKIIDKPFPFKWNPSTIHGGSSYDYQSLTFPWKVPFFVMMDKWNKDWPGPDIIKVQGVIKYDHGFGDPLMKVPICQIWLPQYTIFSTNAMGGKQSGTSMGQFVNCDAYEADIRGVLEQVNRSQTGPH